MATLELFESEWTILQVIWEQAAVCRPDGPGGTAKGQGLGLHDGQDHHGSDGQEGTARDRC